MKKILFMIHDLGPGGAEKVLVNLVNNMDSTKFEITVMALFGGGVNEQFLNLEKIRLINCHKKTFPGNSRAMKLFSPAFLFRHYVKDKYDIVVSYLEGPCARIISGCRDHTVKSISWIHTQYHEPEQASISFRSFLEAQSCYHKFDRIICVSQTAMEAIQSIFHFKKPVVVLYNTVESDLILQKSKEPIVDGTFVDAQFKLCGVGKVQNNKGFDRLARIHGKLRKQGIPVHTYILGSGPEQDQIERYLAENGLSDTFAFLGYRTNPYQFVSNCDLFVCASHAEGFSTAATEALIVGTPVVTTLVSGMKEMLGENNEYGVVTENEEEPLYQAIFDLIRSPDRLKHYQEQSMIRGKDFSTEKTVQAVENMLMTLLDE